jgi:hypothetical protein
MERNGIAAECEDIPSQQRNRLIILLIDTRSLPSEEYTFPSALARDKIGGNIDDEKFNMGISHKNEFNFLTELNSS